MNRSILCAITAAILSLGVAVSQDNKPAQTMRLKEGAERPKAKVADLAWLEGRWVGKGLGGTVEEVWTPPLGDSMMGMFRLVKDGKVVFSEHCFITEVDGSILLKLKHFDRELKGWEDKDASVKFPLAKLEPNTAYFDGATFRRSGDDTLQVFVAIRNKKTGEVREEEFRYQRAK
jgi:hypothetical protein